MIVEDSLSWLQRAKYKRPRVEAQRDDFPAVAYASGSSSTASSLLPAVDALKIEAVRHPAGAIRRLRLKPRDSLMTCRVITWSFLALSVLPAESVQAAPVSFRNDVMAVLSRAGCNQGACHGNQNGKNGFKLSLRGQDPDFDFDALTRDTLGRRTDRLHPEDSLILAKATSSVPHEGGKRFDRDSLEYRLLRTLDRRGDAARSAGRSPSCGAWK